ncbi:class I SAM-dependent methyltransferase [Actinophytocola xanthii]|uniref:class I SAM-dependent methyltransferase n=1 Tax=Actinophytocola xanthii TaxID=1912961 RepID=UPI000B0A87FA|nr:class I SAM-dependent methyltransferase [Actinophytocola xanthii]
MPLDDTGKASFDHVYTEPDPRPYFRALHALSYQLPQLAKPYFARLLDEYRAATGNADPTVLDVGCSYGVNAVLYRCDASMDKLHAHYADPAAQDLDRDALLARDRALLRDRDRDGDGGVRFVGLDTSAPAVRYAREAGFLDDAVAADLERDPPDADQSARLGRADLVISTGCLGYVTEATIARLAGLRAERRPWMAHFVLRMFSYTSIAERLASLGYETVGVPGVFRQRRFASAEERDSILASLRAAGVDPSGVETEGWLCAELHVSLPRGADRSAAELATALGGVAEQSVSVDRYQGQP